MITNIEADKHELNGEKFTCPYCNTNLTFRRSGKRQLKDRVIDIPPYFRLENNIEHGRECDYNTLGQVEIIARKSIAMKDFMDEVEKDQCSTRLQVFKKAMAEPPNEEEEGTTTVPSGNSAAS